MKNIPTFEQFLNEAKSDATIDEGNQQDAYDTLKSAGHPSARGGFDSKKNYRKILAGSAESPYYRGSGKKR